MVRVAASWASALIAAVMSFTAPHAETTAATKAALGNSDTQSVTGLPVPRYVSLRSDEVNLRTGPGVRYPIEWIFQKRHLPVEVLAEFEQWRKIRDWQGTEGWVFESMLSGARYAVVTGAIRVLHSERDPKSPPVARLEPGVIAQLLECDGQWCRLDSDGFKGWMLRSDFWGVYPNEAVR